MNRNSTSSILPAPDKNFTHLFDSQSLSTPYGNTGGFTSADGSFYTNDQLAAEGWAHRKARQDELEQGDYNNTDMIAAVDFSQRLMNDLMNAGAYGMMNDGPGSDKYNLVFPESVNLHDKDVINELLGWAKFIYENDIRDISIGRIINFLTLKKSDKKFGVRYSGFLRYANGWAKWSTQGLPKIKQRKLVMGVDPIAMPDGNGGYTKFSIVFEGYPIYSDTYFVNLFEIVFDSYETFEKAFKTVFGNQKPYFIEGR